MQRNMENVIQTGIVQWYIVVYRDWGSHLKPYHHHLWLCSSSPPFHRRGVLGWIWIFFPPRFRAQGLRFMVLGPKKGGVIQTVSKTCTQGSSEIFRSIRSNTVDGLVAGRV